MKIKCEWCGKLHIFSAPLICSQSIALKKSVEYLLIIKNKRFPNPSIGPKTPNIPNDILEIFPEWKKL